MRGLLQITSLAHAKETITVETFCYEASLEDGSLQCVED